MNFSYEKSLEILERTPHSLQALLQGLSPEWTHSNEGGDTWNVPDVLGHLVYCDTNNWLKRIKHLLAEGEKVVFPSFDRFAQFQLYKDREVDELLELFKQTRTSALIEIKSLNIVDADFEKKGLHPDFGVVKLSQLFSTWVVHDLSHYSQITRVIAKRYASDVGPWVQYLRILK
jgi:hypothetical protein